MVISVSEQHDDHVWLWRWYRARIFGKIGKTETKDYRRRAALDLIEMIERYFSRDGMLWVAPRRRSSYTPADDQAVDLSDRGSGKPASGALLGK